MIRLPRRLGFHHGIQNHEQLSHCSNQSNLPGFSAVPQPLVELSNPLVVLDGRHGRHVQRVPHRRPPALDVALPFPVAAFLDDRRHAHELGNLLTAGLAKLWKQSQKRACSGFPEARNRAEQLLFGLPGLALLEGFLQLLLRFGKLLLQEGQVTLDAWAWSEPGSVDVSSLS
jgi:hypothetical protein